MQIFRKGYKRMKIEGKGGNECTYMNNIIMRRCVVKLLFIVWNCKIYLNLNCVYRRYFTPLLPFYTELYLFYVKNLPEIFYAILLPLRRNVIL